MPLRERQKMTKIITKTCRTCKKLVDVTEEGACPKCGRELVPRRVSTPHVNVKGGTPKFH